MKSKVWMMALLLTVSMTAIAQDDQEPAEQEEQNETSWQVKVDLNESYTGGQVEVTGQVLNEEDGSVDVTITLTPDEGYTITKDDIKVVLTRPSEPQNTREGSPGIAESLELQDTDDPLAFVFTVPSGFGAWVMEANFQEKEPDEPNDISGDEKSSVTWDLTEGVLTLSGEGITKDFNTKAAGIPWNPETVTSVVIEKGVISLGAEIFAGCSNLTSITIDNSEQVVELGEGAIPGNEGLTIDVHGNLYNEYLITEGWDKLAVVSSDAVQMEGFSFSEDNGYDTFVSSEAMVVPSVLKAYTITGLNENGLVLTEVTRIAPGEPVLVFTEEQKISDFYTVEAGEGLEGDSKNLLKVAPEGGKEVDLGDVYLLYNDVFYYAQAGTIREGIVYLSKPEEEEQLSKTRSFYSLGGDDGTTAIDSHRFENLGDSTAWYSLDGRRLSTAPIRKGIYINNGKKVVIK